MDTLPQDLRYAIWDISLAHMKLGKYSKYLEEENIVEGIGSMDKMGEDD